MSFLAPLAFWVAAIVVPALLILYFLKLRRRQEIVPSTLLWRRAVQDLQVNAPFQKLRKNLLLFLQLLILALGVFALARPMIETSISDEESVVLLIDRSASMNTLEGDKTRFEMAKEYAVRHVETLNRTRSRWWSFFGEAQARARVMAIAFADRAVVVSPFTGNMTDVVDLIEKLEPTDGRTNMREALELAEAYMMQTTLEQTPETAEEASAIVLFSDGAVHGVEDVVLRAGRLTLIPIGQARDNVGITALRIQRNYERPELLSTLLQVENFGPEPATTDVSLYIDGRLATVQTVERLAAARARGVDAVGSGDTGDGGPEIASAALSFEFALETGGLLEARLSRGDALLVDNSAFVIVPPPRRLSVLLVSKQNFFVESALQGLSLEKYDYLTPGQYEQAPADEIELNGQSLYDVVILDKHSTSRLPSGNYVFLGAVPENEGITIEDELEDHSLQWWDETHPILRSVALDYVFAAQGLVLKTPPRAEKLIEGPRGSVLFRYSNEGRHYLVLSFAIENSSWWGKISFPKFVQNAVLFMGSGGALAEREPLRPGDPLRIPLLADTETATLVRPDGGRATIRPDARGVARYAATHRVGVYRVEPGVAGQDRFAVNLESASESDITPRASFPLGGAARIEVGDAIRSATPEIWRWFIGAALLIAFLEWYIYNRRVMI